MTSVSIFSSKTSLILSLLKPLLSASTHRPLFVALSGIQGSGKSTLVTELCNALTTLKYRPISLSLDDFYLPASGLAAAATAQPDNKLLLQRGQPGTHDVRLANEVFGRLRRGENVKLPAYDKGAKGGRGDRRPEEEWREVDGKADLLLLEGWCVGFQPLSEEAIKDIYLGTKKDATNTSLGFGKMELAGRRATGKEVLLEHKEEDLLYINEMLKEYCNGFMDMGSYDAMVHLDAEDLEFVYEWRLEQERKLRQKKGQGMNDEEVEAFGEGSAAILAST